MKGKQIFLTGEGVAVLEQCRRLLERRDGGVPWSNARVVHAALVQLKRALEFKPDITFTKEKADGE